MASNFAGVNLIKYLILFVYFPLVVTACGGSSSGSNPQPSSVASPYKIIDLGVGYVGDLNELGHVTGISNGQAYIYDGKIKSFIGTYATGIVSPNGINNIGKVVATYRPVAGSLDTSVAYYNGTDWSLLGKFGGELGWASDINDNGQISGSYKPVGSGIRGYIYTSSKFTVIPFPEAGKVNAAYEINKNGLVCGSYENTSSINKSYVYDGSTVTVVGSFNVPSIRKSYNYGLNDAGDSVGKSQNSSFQYRAFLYKNSTMIDLGTLSGNSVAYDINNSGLVIGDYIDANGDNRAFIHDGTSMKDLTKLLNDQSWVLVSAKRVNDKGMIIGNGLINNETHGFLLISQ